MPSISHLVLCALCLFSLVGVPGVALAQSCSLQLSGTVASQDNETLPAASVRIIELNINSITNNEGFFDLAGLCPGTYHVEVSYLGFAPVVRTVELTVATKLTVALMPVANALNEVVTTGQRQYDTPLAQQSVLEHKALALTRGQSLGEALKNIPGLSTIQTGPSIVKPVIHGMHSNRVLIYNAGVRQEGQQWGSEHAPEVDPFVANRVTVVKGAASVMYGADAVGGIILVEPAPLDYRPGLRGRVESVLMSNNGLGALSATAEGAAPHGLLSYRVQLTTRQAANARTPDYYLKNTGFREYNGSAALGFAKGAFTTELYASTFNTHLGIYEGAHIGNTTDLMAAIERTEPLIKGDFSYAIGRPYQLVGHHLVKFKSSYDLPRVGQLHLQYSYQRNDRKEYDLVRQAYENEYQLRFDLTTQAVDAYLDHVSVGGLRGKIGVNAQHQQNYYDGRYLIPFFTSYNAGAFATERWTSGRLELEAGVRYDQRHMQARLRQVPTDQNSPEIRPAFDYAQLTGTVGAAYQLPAGWRLNAGAAKGWRPPSINELFSQGVHHSSARYELGDRTLGEESTLNLYGGVAKTGPRLNGELSFYHNTLDNYIYLRPGREAVLTVRGAFLAYNYVQVNAEIYGTDASASYRLTDWLSASAKYSAVRAYNRQSGQHLELIPADRVSGGLTLSLPDWARFADNTLSVAVVHTARQWRVRADQDVAPPPAGYTLCNVDFSTEARLLGQPMTLSLSAYNLFNTTYRDYLNAFRYFAPETGRNVALRLAVPFGHSSSTSPK
ncbi:TonB-dependent receptor [Hymenobacter arizonensis]|uniref:TonB-dependent receptor n=1 Tax=Hymenobacter arizonensis TaxID=1227077 RepID=UPI0015A6E247|nr:TonB-dependent receptor [Hymenobacter arizonensis]